MNLRWLRLLLLLLHLAERLLLLLLLLRNATELVSDRLCTERTRGVRVQLLRCSPTRGRASPSVLHGAADSDGDVSDGHARNDNGQVLCGNELSRSLSHRVGQWSQVEHDVRQRRLGLRPGAVGVGGARQSFQKIAVRLRGVRLEEMMQLEH